MIERFDPPRLLMAPPHPTMFITSRAHLECGCEVMVGMRIDNHEVATMAGKCSSDHEPLMRHFDMLLRESLVDPRDEELVVVCDSLLDQAERYV